VWLFHMAAEPGPQAKSMAATAQVKGGKTFREPNGRPGVAPKNPTGLFPMPDVRKFSFRGNSNAVRKSFSEPRNGDRNRAGKPPGESSVLLIQNNVVGGGDEQCTVHFRKSACQCKHRRLRHIPPPGGDAGPVAVHYNSRRPSTPSGSKTVRWEEICHSSRNWSDASSLF